MWMMGRIRDEGRRAKEKIETSTGRVGGEVSWVGEGADALLLLRSAAWGG